MKKNNRVVIYIVVAFIVVIMCAIFLKLFAFNKEKEKQNNEEVSEEVINKLYSYINSDAKVYNDFYVTVNNLNYNSVGSMTYNYILKYDPFTIEKLTDEEYSNLSSKGKPLFKILKENFDNDIKYVFGSKTKGTTNNMEIGINIRTEEINNYLYFYEKENIPNNYVYYSYLDKYTVTDNNNTIKLYTYYLRCNTETNNCYDSNSPDAKVVNVTYSDNLNIESYKSVLKAYEHVFEFENGYYYWVSTQGI